MTKAGRNVRDFGSATMLNTSFADTVEAFALNLNVKAP